eukprot:2489604-Prymnesium_polylepis.1
MVNSMRMSTPAAIVLRRSSGSEAADAPTLVDHVPFGLKWQDVGHTEPSTGQLLINEQLAGALAVNSEFTKEQWAAFGIRDLRTD